MQILPCASAKLIHFRFGVYYINCGTMTSIILSLPVCVPDSPKRFWWYHWMCWSLSAVGIFCILLAHDHYTVDVVVAYFITTRLFWWYHTLANQQVGTSTGLDQSQSLFTPRFCHSDWNMGRKPLWHNTFSLHGF